MASMARSLPRLSLSCSLAASRPLPTVLAHKRFALGDYSGGIGEPKGEKPQKQGPNPSVDKEYPGPSLPKSGYGSIGATNSTVEGHENGWQSQIQKRSYSNWARATRRGTAMRRYHTSRAAAASEKRPKSTDGLSPKILNESPPAEDAQPREVKEHNEEMGRRAERAHEAVANQDADKDKVSPRSWSGQGEHNSADGKPEGAKY